MDGAAAFDQGWVAVSDAPSVSGSGPAAWVVALRWEPEPRTAGELEPARPWAAELRSGQSLEHVMPAAIQRQPAPRTLVGLMGWLSYRASAVPRSLARALGVHPGRRSVRLERR